MKTKRIRLGLLCLVLVLAGMARGEASDEETRAILNEVLEIEYCGSSGFGVGTAIRGHSPVPGQGFVRLEEAEWGPVLVKMAGEELDRCKAATPEIMAMYHKAQEPFADGKGLKMSFEERDAASGPVIQARRKLEAETRKLHKMLFLMGQMEVERDGVVRMIGRFALECPPEYGLNGNANGAWIRQTMKDGNVEKCLELGKRYRAEKGKGSGEEIDYCCQVAAEVLPACTSEEYGRVARYVLETMEECGDYGQCLRFDDVAAERLRGWVGSLQRRRMAARFLDWRPQRYNPETGAFVQADPTPEELSRMLTTRAAAELAADEKDLTDLREVYGEWPLEEQAAEASFP